MVINCHSCGRSGGPSTPLTEDQGCLWRRVLSWAGGADPAWPGSDVSLVRGSFEPQRIPQGPGALTQAAPGQWGGSCGGCPAVQPPDSVPGAAGSSTVWVPESCALSITQAFSHTLLRMSLRCGHISPLQEGHPLGRGLKGFPLGLVVFLATPRWCTRLTPNSVFRGYSGPCSGDPVGSGARCKVGSSPLYYLCPIIFLEGATPLWWG